MMAIVDSARFLWSQQRWIPQPLIEARDRTSKLMDTMSGSFFFGLFAFSRAAPAAYGGSQARGPIRAVATGLHHSHSNSGSEPRLRPTPQLTATLDP